MGCCTFESGHLAIYSQLLLLLLLLLLLFLLLFLLGCVKIDLNVYSDSILRIHYQSDSIFGLSEAFGHLRLEVNAFSPLQGNLIPNQ